MRNLVVIFTFLATALAAQNADNVFFENKILPVLATSCNPCHSSKSKSPIGGLALDTKPVCWLAGTPGLVWYPASLTIAC